LFGSQKGARGAANLTTKGGKRDAGFVKKKVRTKNLEKGEGVGN